MSNQNTVIVIKRRGYASLPVRKWTALDPSPHPPMLPVASDIQGDEYWGMLTVDLGSNATCSLAASRIFPTPRNKELNVRIMSEHSYITSRA